MRRFDGRVVVITGAGSGIGRAAAAEFASLGARLVLADIVPSRLEEVARSLEGEQVEVHVHTVDVGSESQMREFAQAVVDEVGAPDVLVNNAGIGIGCEVRDMSLEDWHRIVDVNYWGTVHGIHFFLPGMLERGRGHIVNIASANGLFALPLEGAYASTKFAVVGLSEAMRAELRHAGIGVSVVCPGLTRTAILDDAMLRSSNEKLDAFLPTTRRIIARRGVDPRVVARAIPRAVVRNRAVVKVPFHVVVLDWFHRHFPWVYRQAIAWGVEKLRGDR